MALISSKKYLTYSGKIRQIFFMAQPHTDNEISSYLDTENEISSYFKRNTAASDKISNGETAAMTRSAPIPGQRIAAYCIIGNCIYQSWTENSLSAIAHRESVNYEVRPKRLPRTDNRTSALPCTATMWASTVTKAWKYWHPRPKLRERAKETRVSHAFLSSIVKKKVSRCKITNASGTRDCLPNRCTVSRVWETLGNFPFQLRIQESELATSARAGEFVKLRQKRISLSR